MRQDIQPTPDTVTAVAEVLKLASYLDDRIGGPDKNRIKAWATQVQRHELGAQDLLAGLQAFYDGTSTHAIGIGDLVQHARKNRRERNEAEDRAVSERRQALHDTKAADEILATAGALEVGTSKGATPRVTAAKEALQCCYGEDECKPAVYEYIAARKEAAGKRGAA